jgi:hypothetical protein
MCLIDYNNITSAYEDIPSTSHRVRNFTGSFLRGIILLTILIVVFGSRKNRMRLISKIHIFCVNTDGKALIDIIGAVSKIVLMTLTIIVRPFHNIYPAQIANGLNIPAKAIVP